MLAQLVGGQVGERWTAPAFDCAFESEPLPKPDASILV